MPTSESSVSSYSSSSSSSSSSSVVQQLDTRRVGLFALFGGYYGTLNYFIFRFFTSLPFPGGRLAGAVGMTLVDSMVRPTHGNVLSQAFSFTYTLQY